MTLPRGPHPALAAWAALRSSGAARGALVTLVRADGGASRALGTHLAVADDGRAFGSVTIGGCADGRAMDTARRVIASGQAEQVTLPLSEEDALALGLGCAGNVDLVVQPVSLANADASTHAFDAASGAVQRGESACVATRLNAPNGFVALAGADVPRSTGIVDRNDERWFAERLEPVRTLLVVGANDIAAALCDLSATLGWRAVLVDSRDDVLAQPRFASASERVAAIAHEAVSARLLAAPGAAVVIVAHDYRLELPVLREALRAPRYVGMLGSRKRGTAMRQMLVEDGLVAEEVSRLRTPIGLAIGAEGPAEIAVSIVAELVQAWRGAGLA